MKTIALFFQKSAFAVGLAIIAMVFLSSGRLDPVWAWPLLALGIALTLRVSVDAVFPFQGRALFWVWVGSVCLAFLPWRFVPLLLAFLILDHGAMFLAWARWVQVLALGAAACLFLPWRIACGLSLSFFALNMDRRWRDWSFALVGVGILGWMRAPLPVPIVAASLVCLTCIPILRSALENRRKLFRWGFWDLFFIASRAWILALPFRPLSDLSFFHSISEKVFSRGLIPYRDFTFGYPPGGLLAVLLPGCFTNNLPGYVSVFHLLALLADAAIYILLRGQGKAQAGFYAAAVFALSDVAYERFDLWIALGLVWIFAENQRQLSSRWWLKFFGLGMLKAFFLAPFALLKTLTIKNIKCRRGGVAALSAAMMLILGLAAIPEIRNTSGWGLTWIVDHLIKRGIQIESIPSSILMAWHGLRGDRLNPSWIENSYQSFQWKYEEGGTLRIVSQLALGLSWALWCFQFVRVVSLKISDLRRILMGMMLLMVCLGWVFSPQYWIWLIALVALEVPYWKKRDQGITLILLSLAILLSAWIVRNYESLIWMNSWGVGALLFRNSLTVLLTVHCLSVIHGLIKRA